MEPTSLLRRLDEVHSLFYEGAQENESVVLRVLASLIGAMPALDKMCNSPDYWREVALNLNTLADELDTENNDGIPIDQLTDDNWDVASLIEGDN